MGGQCRLTIAKAAATGCGIDLHARAEIDRRSGGIIHGGKIPFAVFIANAGVLHKRIGELTSGTTVIGGDTAGVTSGAKSLGCQCGVECELFIQIGKAIGTTCRGIGIGAIGQGTDRGAKM